MLFLLREDTNGVLASALAAVKLGVRVGHVEAGLRSFDLRMPEEHNRRLTDHVSAFLFAPTEAAEENLKRESVWGRVFVVGNTGVDAVVQYLPVALEKSGELRVMENSFGFEKRSGFASVGLFRLSCFDEEFEVYRYGLRWNSGGGYCASY